MGFTVQWSLCIGLYFESADKHPNLLISKVNSINLNCFPTWHLKQGWKYYFKFQGSVEPLTLEILGPSGSSESTSPHLEMSKVLFLFNDFNPEISRGKSDPESKNLAVQPLYMGFENVVIFTPKK